MGQDTIKVFLVDDHHIVRSALKGELDKRTNISVIGEASNGREAIEMLQNIIPDVILMDISMPEMNGLKATGIIKKKMPDVKILCLSMHDNKNYVSEIIRLGASGYVLKDSSPEELIEAIETVNDGKTYYSRRIKTEVLQQNTSRIIKSRKSYIQPELTKREGSILKKLVNGNSNKDIAVTLSISVRTVETHRDHIYKKLNVKSLAGLTKYAIAAGIIEIS